MIKKICVFLCICVVHTGFLDALPSTPLDSLIAAEGKGKLFILSGPSGVGKNTLLAKLRAESHLIDESVSYTTRSPRHGEQSGRDYYFVTPAEFQAHIDEGDFLEYVSVYGNSYGTSKREVESRLAKGHHVFLVIDTQGAHKLRDRVLATSIFIAPPAVEELKTRLGKRNSETEESLSLRLAAVEDEVKCGYTEYDYVVINDQIEKALEILRSIVIAETHRSTRN